MTLQSGPYEFQHDTSGYDGQGLLPSEVAIPSSGASQVTVRSQETHEEVVYDVPRKHLLDDIGTESNPSYAAISVLHTGTASPESETPCSEGLSIQQLVQNHSKFLPARVKVVRGYYGQNIELITDEHYNIHFVKRQKVVNIKDAQGTVYTIPLASSLQFGLVSNCGTQQEDGITFHKASDIMAQKILPGVVCATKAFQGADDMSSVLENEILKVQCHSVELDARETLKAFSFTTQSRKVLQADCAGDFSTKLSLIRLHLSDITTCIPCRAVVFIDEMATPPTVAKKFSTSLLSGPINITESKVETSLVASLSNKLAKTGEVTFLDIPLADHLAEVEFALMEPISTLETQLLREGTRNIMRKFDPRKLKHLREAKSARIARVQSLLYTEVRKSQEMVGIELECSIEDERPPPTTQMKLIPRESTPKQKDNLPNLKENVSKLLDELLYETPSSEPERDGVHIHDPATQSGLAVLTKPKPTPANSKESTKQSRVPPPTPPRKYFPSSPLHYEAIDDIYPPGKSNVPTEKPAGKADVPTGKPSVPTEKPAAKADVPAGKPSVPTEKPAGKADVPAGKPTGKPSVPTGKPAAKADVPPGKPSVPTEKPAGKADVPTGKPSVPPTGSGYPKPSPKPTPAVRKKPEVYAKPSKVEDDSYERLNFQTRTEPVEVRLNLLESMSKKHDQALQRLDDMQSTLERVTTKLLLLETQVQTLTLSSESAPLEENSSSSSSKSTRQQNKKYLCSLDNTQVG